MYARLAARPLGRASLHKIRTHCGMAFEFGVRREYVPANIVRSSKLPANAAPPMRPTWLDRDAFAAMRRHLAASPSTYDTALLTVLLTGLRPGEALGVRWDRIDLDGGLVAVRGALQAQRNQWRYLVIDELKTEASRRVVELPADLVAALRRERAAQAMRRMAAVSWVDGSLVFTTDRGTHLHPANLRRACRAACQAIGIAELSPHKLRHSFASTALDAGLSVPAVARALGHNDGRMLVTTYGHSLDDVVPTAAALDRLSG